MHAGVKGSSKPGLDPTLVLALLVVETSKPGLDPAFVLAWLVLQASKAGSHSGKSRIGVFLFNGARKFSSNSSAGTSTLYHRGLLELNFVLVLHWDGEE